MSLPLQYEKYLNFFEEALQRACENMAFEPPVLTESMRYSLRSGGKRLRPVLFLALLDASGCDYQEEAALAVALECVHTYSLVHDDLPAMDNDDFRRGRPSNHKVFGEANAILAGDGLLSYAFDLVLSEGARDSAHLKAGKILSEAAGCSGMISGQSYDLAFTGKQCGEEELFKVYERKTGALLAAPLRMASAISGKNAAFAEGYGAALGALFQITDDIIDEIGECEKVGKTLGKDKAEDKLTAIKVFGLEGALSLADEYAQKCSDALTLFEGDGAFFAELIGHVRRRNK